MEFFEAVQVTLGMTFGALKVSVEEGVWYADTIGALPRHTLTATNAADARAEAVAWLNTETPYRVVTNKYGSAGDDEGGYTYTTAVVFGA